MKLKDIVAATNAKEIYVDNKEIYEEEFRSAFASDLMSDALCHLREADDDELLITGLANMQIFHTASTLDLKAILLVRGKRIDDNLIKGAQMNHISLFVTDYTMYETCGRLYEKGLSA